MNEVPKSLGPALILVCSYRGAADRTAPSDLVGWKRTLVDAVTLRKLREYVATWRDFYANPRNAAYQRRLAEAVAARCAPGSSIVVDARLAPEAVPVTGVEADRVSRRDLGAEKAADLPSAPVVVFVYPDPLGLSWQRLEAAISAQGRSMFIVNGRGRLFRLDRQAARALRLRRFMATTRIAELLAGLLLVPISGIFALRDRLNGRT